MCHLGKFFEAKMNYNDIFDFNVYYEYSYNYYSEGGGHSGGPEGVAPGRERGEDGGEL